MYEEALKELLIAMNNANLPYKIIPFMNGYQVICLLCPSGDVVCHDGSMGHTQGLWESFGLDGDGDDATGYLTAEAVVRKMKYSID